jgi:hypothetical protein
MNIELMCASVCDAVGLSMLPVAVAQVLLADVVRTDASSCWTAPLSNNLTAR